MIAVLTKYEALVDRVKLKLKKRQITKYDVSNYAKKEVLEPLQAIEHKPAAIVQTHRKLFKNYNNKNTNIKTFKIKGKVVNY